MPIRKSTSKPTIGSAIANIPLQSLGTKLSYIVLLIAFLVIGYLIGKVESLQKGAATVAVAPAPSQQQGQPGQPAAPKITLDAVKKAFDKAVIKFGSSSSKNVVIEAADPSCPFCHAAAGKNPELSKQMGPQFTPVSDGGTYVAPVPELKKLLDEGKISYAYIYTPGHGNGEMGIKAFYCAFENGKFWEAHDLIMSNKGYDLLNNTVKNDKTKSQDVADFLAPVIDPSFMKSCLDSGKYDKTPQEETSLASSIGASGTPTYYINDTQKVGALSFTEFKPLIK